MRDGRKKFILALIRLREGLGIGFELVPLRGDLATLLVKLEENAGFAAQNVRLDRLIQEVDRAGFVSAKSALPIGCAGREKDNRRPAGPLGSPHELSELVPIHLGHLHVKNGKRDVVGEQKFERLRPRARFEQDKAVASKEALQRQQDL